MKLEIKYFNGEPTIYDVENERQAARFTTGSKNENEIYAKMLVKLFSMHFVVNSLPFNYETLPTKIQEKMFNAHQHGDLVDDEEIVYRESDVLDIINAIYGNDL